jgi:hypothetical protein
LEIPYFRAVRGNFSPTKLICFEQVRGFESLFFRGGTPVPSGIPGLTGNSGDVQFAKAVTEWYEKAYPSRRSSPTYNIYITGRGYIPFSKDSKKEDYGHKK